MALENSSLCYHQIPPPEQLRILYLLWQQGPLTGYQIHNRVTQQRQASKRETACYMSTLKQLGLMEKKTLITCDRGERSNRYSARSAQATIVNRLKKWLRIFGLKRVKRVILQEVAHLLCQEGLPAVRYYLAEHGYSTDYRSRMRSA